MSLSEILNICLGGGLVALILAMATMRATIREANAKAEKARAEAEQAKADAEAVRITNAGSATRVLMENIVNPLKEELHATRDKLSATEGILASIQKELASTKRAVARLSRAVESANNCPHADDCVVLRRLRREQREQRAAIGVGTGGGNPRHCIRDETADDNGDNPGEPGEPDGESGQPP